jgi:hypothetical protein
MRRIAISLYNPSGSIKAFNAIKALNGLRAAAIVVPISFPKEHKKSMDVDSSTL